MYSGIGLALVIFKGLGHQPRPSDLLRLWIEDLSLIVPKNVCMR
jgi:hypothetical protein